MGAGFAAGGSHAIPHGKRYGTAEGKGSALGEEEVIVELMQPGSLEGREGIDAEQKDFGEGEEPEADTEGVAAAMREEQDQRPEEIELLFHGQGPEVIER